MFINFTDFQKIFKYYSSKENKIISKEEVKPKEKYCLNKPRKFNRNISYQMDMSLYTIYEDPNEDLDKE